MRMVYATLLSVVLAAPLGGQDRWQVRSSVDEITDDKRTFAIVAGWGADPDQDRFFGRPTIVLRCDTDRSRDQDFWVDTEHIFLNSGDAIPVVMRVDQEEPIRVRFTPDTEGTAGFLPDSERGVLWRLLPQMKAGATLRIRMQDYRGTNYDFRFSLTGFTAALERLTCFSAFTEPPEEPYPIGEGTTPSDAIPIDSLLKGPTLTPYTVAPAIKDRGAVARALGQEYPPLLRDAGIPGTAEVWLLIDTRGSVRKTEIKESSGHPALDEAALRVANAIEFNPAYNKKERVPVWISLPITFGGRLFIHNGHPIFEMAGFTSEKAENGHNRL